MLQFSGVLLAAEVALESIEVHQTHEWLHKPTIYFQCKGENKTFLPDVRKANVLYAFKGEESWQVISLTLYNLLLRSSNTY